MHKICVLIPSYNEAKTIGRVIKEARAQGLSVYVVDDGSSDNTAAIAESEGAVVLKNKKNMGKGASLREGFKHILKKDFDEVLVMDGDNQHEAASIPAFIKEMDRSGADIVIGNRMLNTGSMPYIRKKTNRFMSYVISKISGQDIPDTQCGYRLIKRKVLDAITLESSKFEIESELIIKASRKGFRISSVPVSAVYEDEQSKINPILDTLRFMAFIIRMGLK
jgi:glycosyltransferase involved in cell wall biosynthesis